MLRAAESSVGAELRETDALIALGYAILALAPRRARRVVQHDVPPTGGPRARWARGEDGQR